MSALEESIGSSPTRCRRSIHEARLKRKLKRRRLNETLQTTLDHPNQLDNEEKDWSRLLYAEETQGTKNLLLESKNNQTRVYGANFDPFADQLQLAAADRMSCRTVPLVNKDHIEVTKGFKKFSDLTLHGRNFDGNESIDCSQIKMETFDVQAVPEYEITESELVHVCEKIEENLVNSGSTLQTPRGKYSKSIVDLILEDFCASPLSPETSDNLHGKISKPPEDSTPTFRFRHKPLRTYSRRRRLMVTDNVPEAPAMPKIEVNIEDNCISSSSSNLSVEERQRVEELDVLEELEHSESFCNNLLNLSAFFTESPPKATHQPLPLDSSQEIFLLFTESSPKATQQTMPSKSSQEIFLTFTKSSPKATQQTMPIASNQERFLTPQSGRSTPIASELEDFAALLSGRVNEIIALRRKYPVVFSRRKARAKNCYGFKCPEAKPAAGDVGSELDSTLTTLIGSIGSSAVEVDILVPETEEVLTIEDIKTAIAAETPGIEAQVHLTCSAPKVCDNNLSAKPSARKDENIFSENEQLWDEDWDFFQNFKTQEILQTKVTFDSNKAASATAKPQQEQPLNDVKSTTNFVVGFKTASSKTTHVSKEAQQRAALMLKDLPELNAIVKDNKCDVVDTNNMKLFDDARACERVGENDDKPISSKTVSLQTPNTFLGFETASRKTISVSNVARQRAARILQNLPELNDKKRYIGVGSKVDAVSEEKSNENTAPNSQAFIGIQIASHKAINGRKDARNQQTDELQDLPILNGIKTLQRRTVPVKVNEVFDDDRPSTSKEASLRNSNRHLIPRAAAKSEMSAILIQPPDLLSAVGKESEIENLAPAGEESHEAASFVGFRTASHKTIRVSENARKKALTILSNLPEFPMERMAEEDPIPASSKKSRQRTADIPAQAYFDEVLKDVQFSEWPLSNESPKIGAVTGKRPLSEVDEAYNVQPMKTSKSSLSDLAVHSPLSSTATQSIIARSNLLSLSKRRKNRKSSSGTDALQQPTSDAVETPNKVRTLAGPAPTTPNLQEFFSAVAQLGTSTPNAQLDSGRFKPVAQKELERDFQQIEWEDSVEVSDKSDATLRQASNLSTASNRRTPTAQERIERLLIYPEPPTVSPIAMARNSKCRRLGLQRSRTLVKPSEL